MIMKALQFTWLGNQAKFDDENYYFHLQFYFLPIACQYYYIYIEREMYKLCINVIRIYFYFGTT